MSEGSSTSPPLNQQQRRSRASSSRGARNNQTTSTAASSGFQSLDSTGAADHTTYQQRNAPATNRESNPLDDLTTPALNRGRNGCSNSFVDDFLTPSRSPVGDRDRDVSFELAPVAAAAVLSDLEAPVTRWDEREPNFDAEVDGEFDVKIDSFNCSDYCFLNFF